jgi:hypothetical protein
MDLMAQIWYSKGRMDYVTFDETKMTMWSRYSIKSNILPTSHPYSSDMSTITLDFGVTGVDNQFLLTWEGDMIVMSPIGHGDEYGKAHADYLIPINNREELDKVMPD